MCAVIVFPTNILVIGLTGHKSGSIPRKRLGVLASLQNRFDALIGADLTWHISAQQHFTFSNYFYPSLSDAGEFRNLTIVGWIHAIDWFEGLALKFGIRNEYDTSESIPNDFNYNFSVLWGF